MSNVTTITEQNGQYRITIPVYIVKAMRLNSGDSLDWTVQSSNTTMLTKMIKVTAIHTAGVRK